MNEKRKYFNSLAEKWDKIMPVFSDEKFRMHLSELKISSDDRILDIGAGTGILRRHLINQGVKFKNIVAIDIAEQMLKNYRMKFSEHMNLVCSDAHYISLHNCSFDKIICFSAFPHFKDKKKVLEEFRRLLKKEGKILILHFDSSSDLNSMHGKYGTVVEKDLLPDINELKKIICDMGFIQIRLTEKKGLYFALFQKK